MPALQDIHHVALTATDIQGGVRWYVDLFGVTRVHGEPHDPDGFGCSPRARTSPWRGEQGA